MGLIDSGAGISTISPDTVKEMKFRTTKEQHPINVRNADGSKNSNGKWKESVQLYMITPVWRGNMTFAVVNTAEDKLLLGADWLRRANPIIDWKNHWISTQYGKARLFEGNHLDINAINIKSYRYESRRKRRKQKKRVQIKTPVTNMTCVDSSSDSDSGFSKKESESEEEEEEEEEEEDDDNKEEEKQESNCDSSHNLPALLCCSLPPSTPSSTYPIPTLDSITFTLLHLFIYIYHANAGNSSQ